MVVSQKEEAPVRVEKDLPYSEALFSLTSLPNLMAALVIGEDGLVRENRLKIDLDQDNLGAVTAELFREIKEGLPKVDFGQLQQFLLETEDLGYWGIKLKRCILMLVCRSEANLGYLKIRVDQIVKRLIEE